MTARGSLPAMAVEPLERYMRRVVPFWRTVGIRLIRARGGRAECRLRMTRRHLQNGVMHGGAIASLLDSALACAALSRMYPPSYATTPNMHVTYLRPVTQGEVVCRARALRVGRTMAFCEAKAFVRGRLVATAESQLVRIPLPIA